jgi:hypothetical protein
MDEKKKEQLKAILKEKKQQVEQIESEMREIRRRPKPKA